MENTVNFVLSNTTVMRGSKWLATKAGFFCVPAKGVFSTYKAAARLQYRTSKRGNARASVCSTAVFGGPLFCLPTKCRTHHDSPHRNSHTRRSATQSSRNAPGRGHYSHTEKSSKKTGKIPEKRGVPAFEYRGFQAILEPNTALSTPVHTFTFVHNLPQEAGQHAIENGHFVFKNNKRQSLARGQYSGRVLFIM